MIWYTFFKVYYIISEILFTEKMAGYSKLFEIKEKRIRHFNAAQSFFDE